MRRCEMRERTSSRDVIAMMPLNKLVMAQFRHAPLTVVVGQMVVGTLLFSVALAPRAGSFG